MNIQTYINDHCNGQIRRAAVDIGIAEPTLRRYLTGGKMALSTNLKITNFLRRVGDGK